MDMLSSRWFYKALHHLWCFSHQNRMRWWIFWQIETSYIVDDLSVIDLCLFGCGLVPSEFLVFSSVNIIFKDLATV
jgi:hypothetical protein